MIRKTKINLKNSKGGSGIIVIFLGVIIFASLFMVGGIIPDVSKITEPGPDYIPLTGNPLDSHNTLQLKTIKFKSCGSTAAVNFLVDRSGSMEGDKMSNLKTALNVFSTSFPDDGLIGLQTFSSDVRTDVSFNYFKNVKGQFTSRVNSLFANGGTYSRYAMTSAKSVLESAKANYPGKNLTLIFISDGVPETAATNALCPGGTGPDSRLCTISSKTGNCRCFDQEQDPSSVASEIKNLGVRVFTIGYVNSEDDKFKDDLAELMKRVASSPDDFYTAPIDNQLTLILQQISSKICKDE